MSTTFTLITTPDIELHIDESSSRYDIELYYHTTGEVIILQKELTFNILHSLYKLFDGTSSTFIVLHNEWLSCTTIRPSTSENFIEINMSNIGSDNVILSLPFDKQKVLKTLIHLIEDHFKSKVSLIK